MVNKVRSSLWRVLCIIGIHYWSVPKLYSKKELVRSYDRACVGEVVTMVKGCLVPGCCKMVAETFTIDVRKFE